MNDSDEFIMNRIAQARNIDGFRGEHQVLKWQILQRYLRGQRLTFIEKIEFIRYSLESWRISTTTIDILFRRMIRWTMPDWLAYECLSKSEGNGYAKKVVPSETTPGLFYTVTREGCDCPGFRGEKHCKHHDGFTAGLEAAETVVSPEEVHA